jgi:phage-related holin
MNLVALFATNQVYWIVVLIMVDVILGIIAALVKKDFRLGKLANFMMKPVVGYLFGFAVLELVAQAFPNLIIFPTIAYILIILALLGSILSNLNKMGLPIPTYLKRE